MKRKGIIEIPFTQGFMDELQDKGTNWNIVISKGTSSYGYKVNKENYTVVKNTIIIEIENT